jgi:hypothetical protein
MPLSIYLLMGGPVKKQVGHLASWIATRRRRTPRIIRATDPVIHSPPFGSIDKLLSTHPTVLPMPRQPPAWMIGREDEPGIDPRFLSFEEQG